MWQSIFYKPILQCLKCNDAEKIAESIRICSFVTETIGETKFWFGLDPPDSTGDAAEARGDASRLQSRRGSQASSDIKDFKPVKFEKTKAPPQFVELLSLVVLGYRELRSLARAKLSFASKIELPSANELYPLGQCAMSLEILNMLKRVRIAIRHVSPRYLNLHPTLQPRRVSLPWMPKRASAALYGKSKRTFQLF